MIGFRAHRRIIALEDNEPHDETFSYSLALRYYGREIEMDEAIALAKEILRIMPGQCSNEDISQMCSLIGNMLYIRGDFRLSAGYFIRALSYSKRDITPWIELLFSLRAIGEAELFEKGIFGLEELYNKWISCPEHELTQAKLVSMIK
jgi:tetratricopeptide (TPR) repeat protein